MHHYTIFLRADTITRTDGGEAIVTTILSHCKQQQFLSAYMYHFFLPIGIFLFWPRVFPRALGSVSHREPARTQHSCLGPGRVPFVPRDLGVERATLARGGIPSPSSHPGPCKPIPTYYITKMLKNIRCLMRHLES